MKALNDKTFTEKVLKHFVVGEHSIATNPDGQYAITGGGYCALFLSRDHYDLPYTSELSDEWTTNLSLPRTVLGYISMDRLRSFLLEIASETLAKYTVVNVYANSEQEAEKIARDNVEDWDFDDIELDGIEEYPSIDENDDVFGIEGLLDPEVYMKAE